MEIADKLSFIQKRLKSIDKELKAIKQSGWAGYDRYRKLMDDEATELDVHEPAEKISTR